MGWVALAGAVLSAAAQKSSANAQEAALKVEARQERAAATDREVQRQRRLNAILGSQAAAVAASGVVNSGSVANISLVDARRAREDSQVDEINTSTRITALRSTGAAIRRSSNIRAAATIFQAAGKAYNRGSVPSVGQGSSSYTGPRAATQAGSGLTGATAGLA